MSTIAEATKLTGMTSINIPSGGRSIAILVLKGTINVSLTGLGCLGTNIPVPDGVSFSYSVDSEGENIRCGVTFTGTDPNTEALILQTR